MNGLPSFITDVIEGGKKQQEFTAEELQELEDALASLSPEARANYDLMRTQIESDTFIFTSEDNTDTNNER